MISGIPGENDLTCSIRHNLYTVKVNPILNVSYEGVDVLCNYLNSESKFMNYRKMNSRSSSELKVKEKENIQSIRISSI